MLRKSFRLIASISAFSIGVSQPVPVFALRPHVDQSGLEERLGTAGLRAVLNEQAWNQLKHFSRQMEKQGVPWKQSVEIAGVWADVDRTLTHPALWGNGLSPAITQSYAWIMHQGGTAGAISAAPYHVADLLDADFVFPASMDQRVVGRIQAAVTSPADMQNLRVLARSGGVAVRFSAAGEASITPSSIQFSSEEITRISRALTVAAFHAIQKKSGADLSAEIKELEQAPDILSIARILRDVERAHGLILLEGITPLEIDGGMIFLSFKDNALNSEEILAEAMPVIGETLGQRRLYFIRGPMYAAVSLFEKAETLRGIIDGPSEKPGVWIVAGDGPNDDLKMLKMAAGSQRLVLPYFVGPPDAVAVTDAVVVPHSRRFVEATERFLNEMVSAARDRRSYADLRFIAGEITPRELADALGIPLDDLSARIREMPYSEAAALLARAGLEEAVRPSVINLLQGRPDFVPVPPGESGAPNGSSRFRTPDGLFEVVPSGENVVLYARNPRTQRTLVMEERLEYGGEGGSNGVPPRRLLVVRRANLSEDSDQRPRFLGEPAVFAWKGEPGDRNSLIRDFAYDSINHVLTVYLDPQEQIGFEGLRRGFRFAAQPLSGPHLRAPQQVTLRLRWAEPLPASVLSEFKDLRIQPGRENDREGGASGTHVWVTADLYRRPSTTSMLPWEAEQLRQVAGTPWLLATAVKADRYERVVRLIGREIQGRLVLTLPSLETWDRRLAWLSRWAVGRKLLARVNPPPPVVSLEPIDLFPARKGGFQGIRFHGFLPQSAWKNRQGAAIRLEFSNDGGKSWKWETASQALSPAAAGLEEAVFPKPEPVPSSTPSLRSLGLIDKRGGSPFPLGVGPSFTTFQREGEDIRVFFDLDPDVPAELLNGDGSERFKTFLDGRYLDGENVDPVLRKELREILKRAQSIYVRYKPASAGAEMQMEMIPVNVSLREALVQRSGASKVLHITYEARIPAQRGTMNFAFFGLVTFQDGRQLRLADSGWVRNLDPVSLGLQKAPRAVWRDPLPNGDEVQLALYEGLTAPLWREPAGRRESALESAVSRAMREAQRHPHVTVRVDVGRKAGVSSGSPSEAEFLFTGNLPGLFPLDSNNGPTEHLRVSEEEVWTELRLRHRRAMFVLQAGKAAAAPQGSPGQPSALATEGNRVVQLLKDNGYPDYNAWVVVGEGENVQLFIVPRDPRTNRDGGVVVAPQDYWAVPLAIDGRYVFLTAEELEQFNLASTVYTGSFRKPLLKRGDPILPVSINSLGEQGLLITSDPKIFHDDRYLEARIDLATRLSGVPLNDPGIQTVRQSLKDNSPLNPGDRARQEVLADLAQTVENVDQYIRWLGRIQGWEPRHVSAFGRLDPEPQNAFTSRVLELGQRFSGESSGRVEIRTLQPSQRTTEPLPFAPTENVWAYLDVGGGTQDAMISVVGDGNAKKVVLGLTEGGPANQMVRAFRALQIPASLFSQIEPARISLFLLRPGKREIRLVPRPITSLSVDTLHAVADQLPDLSKGAPSAGRFGAVVIGERIGDSELPFALELAQEAQAAQRKGYAIHLFANSGWSPNVWEALLSAHPRTVFSPYSALANLIGESNPESLRDDLQGRIRAATQADRIRRAHGVREWIVYLETGGLILVTDNGWWHLLPSSQDRLNYSSGAAGAAYAAYLAATSRSVLGSSPRGDLHVAAAEDAVRQSAIFMSQDADNWGKSATREQLAQEHRPEVLSLPIPRDVQEERRVYFAERMAAAEAESRAQQIQRIRDFFAAFPAVPVQPNFTHYLPWLLDLRRLEVTLDPVFTEWDDLPLRREVIAKLSAIPPSAEPQPSYRLVQRLLRASLADSDPETRSLARQYWRSVEQAAGERILTALRNQNSGPIQVGYDSALLSWVSGEQLRYAASQLAGAAQTEVRVAELGALAERLPNERGISLLVPVEESAADRDAQGYPLPNPAVPTAAFPPTESRATLYAEYVRRLISPRVLGVYPAWGSRPQDQAVLERTFLLAAAWASLPENPGPADPVAVALRQYYWTLFSLTVLPEDEALLTQKTENFTRARQKDTVVKKLAIQSSAAVFTALAPESEPPAETKYTLEDMLRDLNGRLRHLTDVRRGQQIVVVPLAVLQQFPILEDFLVRLPRESAETVLVWRTEQAGENSLDRNAHLGSFTGSSLDLRDFLQGQLRLNSVDVVSVLGDEETAAFLRQALAGLGREIRIDFVMGIRGILHALGVPGYEVEKADPEEIERSLQIIRDA